MTEESERHLDSSSPRENRLEDLENRLLYIEQRLACVERVLWWTIGIGLGTWALLMLAVLGLYFKD